MTSPFSLNRLTSSMPGMGVTPSFLSVLVSFLSSVRNTKNSCAEGKQRGDDLAYT
jgi:hypothetical protein